MMVYVVSKRNNTVYVKSKCGSFYGIWCSDEPETNREYHIEIDCDQTLVYGDVQLSNYHEACIESRENSVFVTGILEEIEDGVIILRLLDSIVMIKAYPNAVSPNYIGDFVDIKLKEIKLFDIGI